MQARFTTERAMPWLLRLCWVVVLVAGGPAVDGAVELDEPIVGDVVRVTGLVVWIIGVVGMAIPAVVSLTAVRIIVPTSVVVALACLLAGTDTTDGVLFAIVALFASAVALSAELGRSYVQASAYGEEDRHLLRPPAAYAAAAVVTWAIWAVLLTLTPVLLASERWIIGGIVAFGAVAGGVLGWPRWHRLARRWFVIVPIGVVIHDHLVLAETVLLRRQEIARLRLAPAGTDAADLTGPASGHAVEISTVEPVTVIVAATPRRPGGTAIHLRAGLVAPSRPGQALSAATRRRLPVG